MDLDSEFIPEFNPDPSTKGAMHSLRCLTSESSKRKGAIGTCRQPGVSVDDIEALWKVLAGGARPSIS